MPENINHLVEARRLPGPFILQLVDATDISSPSRLADSSLDRKQRLLRLTLTDGFTKVRGLEYVALDAIKSSSLIPGTKLKVSNVLLRWGLLWLDTKSVTILGGRVEDLAEAWELQQQCGRTTINTTSAVDRKPLQDASTAEVAPSFKPFTASTAKSKKSKKYEVAQSTKKGPSQSTDATAKLAKATKPGKPAVVTIAKSAKPVEAVSNTSNDQNKVQYDAKKPSKLLDKLEETQRHVAARKQDRGRGRGRAKGRRHRSPSSDDFGGRKELTLQEWEALHSSSPGRPATIMSTVQESDEALARRLQEQLNLEQGLGEDANRKDALEDSLASSLYRSMFTAPDDSDDFNSGARGCRGRGGQGVSRGRGRGRVHASRSGSSGGQSRGRKGRKT